MQKIQTPFVAVITTVVLAILAFTTGGCEPGQANWESAGDKLVDPMPDPASDPTPTSEPYVCLDADHDGFCAVGPDGNVVDFNDSAEDADGDGIVDGFQFNPHASESTCDGLDNDNDGQIDEDEHRSARYLDVDGDGYGAGESVETCQTHGFANEAGDCNDHDSASHPGAEDLPGDGIDQDCDDETIPVDSAQPEAQALVAPATVAVTFEQNNKLALDYQLAGNEQELGGWWEDVPPARVLWDRKIVAEFSVSDRVNFVRVNVTIGREFGGKTWLCVGNGYTAGLLEGAEATLEVGDGFEVGEPFLWSEPTGAGCSLVFPVLLAN